MGQDTGQAQYIYSLPHYLTVAWRVAREAENVIELDENYARFHPKQATLVQDHLHELC